MGILLSSLFEGIATRYAMTCYLEGVVMGRHKIRVSLNFVSSVSVVRSYL